jgi:hypothetical protein
MLPLMYSMSLGVSDVPLGTVMRDLGISEKPAM